MAIPLKVLLLEDRSDDAKLILHELRQAGYGPEAQRVDNEADFKAALEPSLDVILADYGLPGWRGSEALAVVQRSGFDIPLILVSGTIPDEGAVEIMQQGAADYLLKDRLARLGPAVTRVITERRLRRERQRAEAEFTASELRYRRLFEAARDGILILNVETGVVVDVNPFLIGLLGLAREAVLGRKIWELGCFKPIIANRDDFAEWQRKECISYDDKPLQAVDGRVIDVEFVGTAYLVDGHTVMQCNFRDITGRRQAELAARHSQARLREEEARFRALVEKAHESVSVLDGDGRFTYTSPSTERVLGFRPEEVIGRSAFKLLHPDDMARGRSALADVVMRPGRHMVLELRVVRGDGAVRWFEVTGTNLLHVPSVQGVVINYRDITERKEAEAALQKSEERFRNMTENTSDWIWETDEQGVYTYASPRIRELLGYEPEEMLGRSPLSFMDADEAAQVGKTFIGLVASRRPIVARENVNRHKDGHAVVLETSAVPIFDSDGTWRGYRGIDRDITERKEAGKKLQLFRTLIERSTDAIEVIDPATGRLLDVNETACRTLGYTREEMLALTVFDIDPEADRSAFVIRGQELKEAGSYTIEGMHRRKDGSVYPVEVSLSRVMLDREYGVTIVRDITLRRKAKEELQLRNVLLSAVQEASIDGILVVDEHGHILSFNRRFIEMWRIPAQLVEDKSDDPLLQTVAAMLADPPSFLQHVRDLYEHREETSREELLLADGRVFDRYSAPMFGAQKRYHGRVWYFRDITDRKKLEEQFIQSQKLEAFGQLAGGVAHDFNNILSVMLMQLNLLQLQPELSGKLVSGLAELERHAMRGADLTRQLLMFSRRQNMEPRKIDLNLLLRDISRMLERLLGEDIAYELKNMGVPLWIEADAGMIEQVVMNLCINARDAMRNGGRLMVEARLDERLSPKSNRRGRFACLAVTDTGCGMNEAIKARIFEPFFTTKPVGKGTGLGLSTVYGIVQQHQGWIEVDSAPGLGSTFRVYLPNMERPVTAMEADRPSEARGGHESILLVEDEEALRSTMSDCLQLAGYRVIEAANGVEALGRWEEGRREFDLVITDYRMPEGMTGVQLANQLGRMKDHLKMIVMSGYIADSKESDTPWPTGVTPLSKPFEARQLLQVVRQCLDAK